MEEHGIWAVLKQAAIKAEAATAGKAAYRKAVAGAKAQ
jgi:hypothetical protein